MRSLLAYTFFPIFYLYIIRFFVDVILGIHIGHVLGMGDYSAKNLEVQEIKAKSILNTSKIYGVDYALNPYLGCMHGCVYCYARFTFIHNNLDPLDWGRTVFPKINAPSLLKREIRLKKKGVVLLSSVTDPYQALECIYRLTRQCIEILLRYGWPINILTKSSLVVRDLDVLERFEVVDVGLTITIVDDEIKSVFEPRASKYSQRLSALATLNKKIRGVYAFVGPIIPLISDRDIEVIVSDLHDIGVKDIIFDKLNVKAKNWITINQALAQLGLDKRAFWRKVRSSLYWWEIKKKVLEIATKYSMNVDFCY